MQNGSVFTYAVLIDECADIFIVTQRWQAAGQIRLGTLQTLTDIKRNYWNLPQ